MLLLAYWLMGFCCQGRNCLRCLFYYALACFSYIAWQHNQHIEAAPNHTDGDDCYECNRYWLWQVRPRGYTLRERDLWLVVRLRYNPKRLISRDVWVKQLHCTPHPQQQTKEIPHRRAEMRHQKRKPPRPRLLGLLLRLCWLRRLRYHNYWSLYTTAQTDAMVCDFTTIF